MELFVAIVTQILTYATLALGSGVIASLLTQALKFEFILAPAKRWPRTVAAIVSAALSGAAVYLLDAFVLTTIIDWVVFGVATFIVATQSYNLVHEAIKNAKENR